MTPTSNFIKVLLPISLDEPFTYSVPDEFKSKVAIGCRVLVSFGQSKVYAGVVVNVTDTTDVQYEIKPIIDLLDEHPIVNALQIKHWKWMAEYYLCSWGDVLDAALPSGLKLSSSSRVQLNPVFAQEIDSSNFSSKEIELLSALKENESLLYKDIEKLLKIKNIYSIIKSLNQKKAIIIYQQIAERYQPKIQKMVRLCASYTNKNTLAEFCNQLESKHPKRLELILRYLQHIPLRDLETENEKGVPKTVLIEGLSTSSLETLVKHEVFDYFSVIVSRFSDYTAPVSKMVLAEFQENAIKEIMEQYNQKDVVLLHGVTGSGKTQIYIDLIKKNLESGMQVLLLVPEIGLSVQIVARLYKEFGSIMGVYHSKFSDNERVEVWQNINFNKYQFIVGVRSAIFLPFNSLGLIIVDEEHEGTYKQQNPSPRYHARESAIMLAHFHKAKVLLGTATPSIESYYLAKNNKYGLVTLDHRFGNAEMPKVKVVQRKINPTIQHDFSPELVESIKEKLAKKEQVILFQNRRGYSPLLRCETCGWSPGCKSCNVSLTYHQFKNELRCHYCGYREKVFWKCGDCGSEKLDNKGIGTEKIAMDLKTLFPDASIARMDLDTTASKNGYERIVNEFTNHQIDILVGTQMISKGFDFDNVTLVGVIDLDSLLNFPDFRAYERAFQMVCQVSGRAGRKEKKGNVIIQTQRPTHPILKSIIDNDFLALYRKEIIERKEYFYPPFSRMIRFLFKSKTKELAMLAAGYFVKLSSSFLETKNILGPQAPGIDKVQDYYLQLVYIKIARDSGDLNHIKKALKTAMNRTVQRDDLRSVQIIADVDCL